MDTTSPKTFSQNYLCIVFCNETVVKLTLSLNRKCLLQVKQYFATEQASSRIEDIGHSEQFVAQIDFALQSPIG